jgi:signal transduction histidine kinase
MDEMLDEMLLLNRIDANRVEVKPSPVDLRSFLASEIEEIRLGDRDGHRFAFHPSGDGAPFVTDPGLLHHMISNLLSNAVRYSRGDTLVTVHLDVTAGHLRVTIEDEGIGIPEKDRPRLFEAFERGSNVGTIKGTGLGLNIVKRMTELLGGTITLEPSTGVGSRFTLQLPPLPAPTPSR